MDYIDKLKIEINESKLNISEISKNSGISRQSIYKILNKKSNASIKTLESICRAIGVNLDEILDKDSITPSLRKDMIDKFECITMVDTNMEPLILKGDTVKIRLQKELDNGDIGFIKIGDNSPILKRVKIENNIMTLYDYKLNDKDSNILSFNLSDLTKHITIIGRVIETRRNF